MKEIKNKQVLIISDLNSPYFEQTIFIIKKDVVCEEDKLVNEARAVVEKFMKKYEAGYSTPVKKFTFLYYFFGLSLLFLLSALLLIPKII